MRKILLTLILLIGFANFTYSQNRTFLTHIDDVNYINKLKLDTLKTLLIKEINFPVKASSLNEIGVVCGEFIVNKKGKLIGIVFTDANINYDFDVEILNTFNKIKKKITFINNTNKFMYYEFRFNFIIENEIINEN